MKTTTRIVILLFLVLLPWLALFVLGGLWLWQNHYLMAAIPVLLSSYGIAWLLGQRMRQDQPLPPTLPTVDPDDRWSPASQEIWDKIDILAKELKPGDYDLTNSSALTALAQRIIAEVAVHFRPEAERAELDVPLRNFLLIIEQVSRDMRELLDTRVPFSHLITVHDGLQLYRWTEKLRQANFVRRTLSMAVSPFTAIPLELRQFFAGKIAGYPKGLLERWLLQTLVKKVGYYAIALYSGHCMPPSLLPAEPEPADSPLARKPVRVLVAGQEKAGKSSLINGLLGEFKAPADVLPVTDALRKYTLRHPDMADVSIYDSPGYGDGSQWLKHDSQQFGDFDLILLVCSALQAGRKADCRFITELRNWYGTRLDLRMPPILAVVSHIDQLRPVREWKPPYDIENPDNEKARNIRGAVDDVASTLQLPREDCVPACLSKPADCYNIEAVLTGMVSKLPESLRSQYLRALSEGKRKEKIKLMLGQLGMRRH
ncbi:MAG: GTPase family protein [Gammaproteobacteria bacterium]